MKVYKDKQFLVFDFEDGKNVKYDFATNQAIGKKGKPVSNLCSQLSGINLETIIDCCIDNNYGAFLKFIKDNYNGYNIYNIGTILSKVEQYSNYEQIFSTGIKQVKNGISISFKDIPKGLLKICREKILNYHNI